MLYFLDVWESLVKGHHKNWSPCLIDFGHLLQGFCPGDGPGLADGSVQHARPVAPVQEQLPHQVAGLWYLVLSRPSLYAELD